MFKVLHWQLMFCVHWTVFFWHFREFSCQKWFGAPLTSLLLECSSSGRAWNSVFLHVHVRNWFQLSDVKCLKCCNCFMSHVESCMPGTENPRGSCYKRPAVGDASGAQSSDNNSCNDHFCHLSSNGFQTFTSFSLSLQCVMFWQQKSPCAEPRARTPGRSVSTELGSWADRMLSAKCHKRVNPFQMSVSSTTLGFSWEIWEFHFLLHDSMNSALKAVRLSVMKSTCKPWPQGHEWAMHDVAWTGSRTESCVWKMKDLVIFF